MFWFGRQLVSAMVWVAIPFVIASGMPRVGCVCASGDHRPFCQGYQSTGPNHAKSCCAGSGCEACKTETANKTHGDRSDRPCCGSSNPSTSSGVAESGRCCQPYLIVPSVVKDNLAVWAPAADDELVWQPMATMLILVAADCDVSTASLPLPGSSGVDILRDCCVLVI